MTNKAAKKYEKDGEKLESIKFFDEIVSKASGGTLNTYLNSFEHPFPKSKSGDPLLKLNGKEEKSNNKLASKI